jgi:catechol 2,3-dioxygenase
VNAVQDYGIRPPAYRLPAATRVGTVRLQVSDLERSLAFYRDLLGMQLGTRDGGIARLGAPAEGAGAARPLVELHERRGAHPVPRRGRLGLYHFAVLLPSRAALGALVRVLAPTGAISGAADHLVSEALYLFDPDGLGVEIYADRPRASWERRGRELVMATEPLDLRAVAAAAEAPWAGMPPGTVVGHVHLHVGDLERARDFYHRGLGLDVVVWGYPGALFLSAGGYHHHLGTNVWAAGAEPAARDEARLLEWELVLPTPDDVQAAAASVEAVRGGESGEGRGAARAAGEDRVLDDPWAIAVRLTASTPPTARGRA